MSYLSDFEVDVDGKKIISRTKKLPCAVYIQAIGEPEVGGYQIELYSIVHGDKMPIASFSYGGWIKGNKEAIIDFLEELAPPESALREWFIDIEEPV